MTTPEAPFQPTNRRALIIQDEASTKHGDLFIPDGSQEAPLTGTVIALSKLGECEFEVGSRVWFSKYAGQRIEEKGKTYLLLKYDEVLAATPPEA